MAEQSVEITDRKSLRRRGRFLMLACGGFVLTLAAIGLMLYQILIAP